MRTREMEKTRVKERLKGKDSLRERNLKKKPRECQTEKIGSC